MEYGLVEQHLHIMGLAVGAATEGTLARLLLHEHMIVVLHEVHTPLQAEHLAEE